MIETSSAKEALALIEGGLVPDVVLTDRTPLKTSFRPNSGPIVSKA